MVQKIPSKDLRAEYRKVLELSLILSLALFIAAFKFFPEVKRATVVNLPPKEVISSINIPEPVKWSKPVSPVLPKVIVEVVGDVVLDDIIFKSEFDPAFAPPRLPRYEETEVEKIFRVVEDNPEPVGGVEAIQRLVVYPEIAKRAGIEGTVYVMAFVDKSGTVVKTEILKGIGGGCDEAAEGAVAKTKFKPGLQRGKPVKALVSIPIHFRLQK